MSNVALPECGLLVDGLPCKRWPGHLGPCLPGDILTPSSVIPPSEFPDFDFEKMLWRVVICTGSLGVLVLFCTVTCIYLLVKLPCRQR